MITIATVGGIFVGNKTKIPDSPPDLSSLKGVYLGIYQNSEGKYRGAVDPNIH